MACKRSKPKRFTFAFYRQLFYNLKGNRMEIILVLSIIFPNAIGSRRPPPLPRPRHCRVPCYVQYCVGGAHFRASHKQSSSTANDVSVFYLMLSALCMWFVFLLFFLCLFVAFSSLPKTPNRFSMVAAAASTPTPKQRTESFKICTLLFAYEINSP